jgi:glycosyltransferase involved in cell wall biosynthesis
MKIGIDAFWYFDGYSSLQRVTYNFVNSLLQNDFENEYVLFFDARFKGRKPNVESHKKLSIKYLRTGSLRYNLFLKVFLLPFYSYLEKTDVFITQYYPSPFSRGKRISFVYDILFESYPGLFTKRERYQLWPQKVFTRMANYIITISESEKNRLLEFRYSRRAESILVYSLAPDEKFKPQRFFPDERLKELKGKYNLPNEFLLYVGLMSGRKNLDNLLRALPLLNIPIPLVITGEKHPAYPSNHVRIIKELGIENRVLFTGFVEDAELPIIYSLSKIFCFPSLAEGFGLPPLEALAAQVPIAVSHRTSLPEIGGECAIYFDPEKPKEIAEALNKLIDDPVFYAQKKAMTLLQASKFSWDKSAIALISQFNIINNQQP